jgi:hypothetical protein
LWRGQLCSCVYVQCLTFDHRCSMYVLLHL